MKANGVARLFDLAQRKRLCEFPVRHECPGFGTRLALARDGRSCFVGCYDAYGIAGYSLPAGKELWRRKDLKAVQAVEVLDFQDLVFCGRAGGAAHLLNARTGETVEKLNGVRSIYGSPFDKSVIVDGRLLELHRPFGSKKLAFQRKFKSVRTCAFSESEVIISESGAWIRCFDLNSGEVVWEIAPAQAVNYVRFVFHKERQCFIALKQETDTRFVFLHPKTGKVLHEVVLEKFRYGEFCRGGETLLRGNLCHYSTATGKMLHDFATPEILACDPKYKFEMIRSLAEKAASVSELEKYMRAEGFSEQEVKSAAFIKTMKKAGQK